MISPRLTALILVAAPLFAQESDPGRVDEWLAEARLAVEEGRDARATSLVRKILQARPGDTAALSLGIGVALNVGQYEDADAWSEQWVAAASADPAAMLARGRVLRRRGRVDAALDILKPLTRRARPAPDDSPAFSFEATALEASLHLMRGRRDAAELAYDRMVQEAKRIVIRSPRDLMALGDAYRFFGGRGPKYAEKDLIEAREAAPTDPELPLALGRLYLETMYLPKEAVREFERVLELRPNLAAGHLGLAEAYAAWMKGGRSKENLRLALSINPRLPEALAMQVVPALGDLRFDDVNRDIEAILAVDPTDRTGLALRAAAHLIAAERERSDAALAEVFAVDPTFARAHLLLATALNERRRWPECLEQCRAGVKLDPADAQLHDAHARYAFFLGLEKEGRAALKKADAADRYGLRWRTNMWKLSGKLRDRFRMVQTPNFVHRIHRSEFIALRPYVTAFAERSYELLSAKYRHTPKGTETSPGRILVEWFNEHDDFSVRTLGFQHLGATGVCFGSFIACDSPSARKPGEFSWARTFHHELAHTMTLELSGGRVPRWLTEGLSTYEEKIENPSWDRYLYRDLYHAYHGNALFKVLGFDAAFGTPRIAFAYFQGGLVCHWLVGRFGFEKILEMLAAYGADKGTEQVLREVLEISPSDFDSAFGEYVAEIIAPMRLLPVPSAARVQGLEAQIGEGSPSEDDLLDLATARVMQKRYLEAQELIHRLQQSGAEDPRIDVLLGRIAAANRRSDVARDHYRKALEAGYEDHDVYMALGAMSEKAGDGAVAETLYRNALKTFPLRCDKGDPRLKLARLALGAGRTDDAVELLESHVALNFEDLKTRKELVRLYAARGDRTAQLRHLRDMVLVYPLNQRLHIQLGTLLLESEDPEEAVREFEVAVALADGGVDEADARYGLARAALEVENDPGRAWLEVRKALALVPAHAAAQRLRKEIEARRKRDSGGDR